MSNKLVGIQDAVFKTLDKAHNTDVKISDMYYAAYPGTVLYSKSTRDMQTALGPHIARINAKLKHGRIVPGELKGTYRLNVSRRSDNK